MGERVEKAFEKLPPLVPHGQTLQAAVSVENCWEEESYGGPGRGLEEYWSGRGFEVRDDVLYDVPYGFLGLTEERLLLAKQTLFGSLKAKHLVLETEAEECGLVWYDRTLGTVRGGYRFLHLTFPEGTFGTARVHLLGSPARSYREVVIAAADTFVAQFGGRGTHVPDPPDEWP
jgi:hypothetical protein